MSASQTWPEEWVGLLKRVIRTGDYPCTAAIHVGSARATGKSPATRLPVCSRCYGVERYGYCHCGRPAQARAGLCTRHHYGTCACGKDATGGMFGGVPVCAGCRYGTCSEPGCQATGANGVRDGLSYCVRHILGACSADGCSVNGGAYMPGTKVVVCTTHRKHGLNYKANAGHRAADPGDIYVVHHAELGLVKVGIGKGAARVAEHVADGWTVVINQSMPTKREAQNFETATLREWRLAGVQVLGPALAKELRLRSVGEGREVIDGTYAYAVELAAWVAAGDPDAPVPLPAHAVGLRRSA